jgi:hypothetical protein
MEYEISLGVDFGTVKHKRVAWSDIAKRLSRHEVALEKGGQYLVGGAFKTSERKEEGLLFRSLLTLDIDEVDMNIDELMFLLVTRIESAFVAYSTFSHQPDRPRIRVIIPLSRNVTPDEYREFSRDFGSALDIPLDNCSFIPNQFMYMPTCPDLSVAWSYVQEGGPLAVPDEIAVPVKTEQDDLEIAIANQPLDLSDDEVDAYLSSYQAEGLEYDEWLRVGAALHHQYQGDRETGFGRWLAWSEKSSKHEPKEMEKKWKSFGNSTRVVTFASIIHLTKVATGGTGVAQVRSTVERKAFEKLAEDASAVCDMDSYDAFKKRIQRIGVNVLPLDKRSLLAQEVYDAWGKDTGLTKTDIKGQLKPAKGTSRVEKDDVPDWVADWVYIEKTCEFYNTVQHYAIKREAFNSKYGREDECVDTEMLPSTFALNICKIETVVDVMFWPSGGMFFSHDGKRFLNSYRQSGIAPCEVMDEDGQAVIDMFMRHVRMTLAHEEEQRLLIDFMAWVVQKPGQKINWALLVQGAQGVGKSYFGVVMQNVLGHMARNVEPMSLAGRFTSWAHGALLAIIEEIRIAGENRYELVDRLKPFISNTTIQIEEKGRDQRTVPNFTSYMMFTNHKDALPLSEGDRRYAPLFSRIQSEQQLFAELGGPVAAADYFTRLFDESERRADALSRFLRDWKISPEFNAKGRAPMTSARQEMMGLATSPGQLAIEDAIEKHGCPIIGRQILDVTWLNKLCELEDDTMPPAKTLNAILLAMGYRPLEGRRMKVSKTNSLHYVWHRGLPDDEVKKAVRDYHQGVSDCPF